MSVPKDGSRVSGFRGTWKPNRRPYVVLTPDIYVAIQGETSIIACGECKRQLNFNAYVTGISTEASVDSPPGSSTINLSIPDNDVNNFYVDGQFVIIPMMEIEIYAKGYYLVGGFPQYYRIFWGLVSSVTKDWSGGSTTVALSCKDILRWWELTNATINPAFLDGNSSSAGSYQLWQNQFAGLNPYTVIIQLAREAMGDFSRTTGSLNDAFLPEKGPENQVIGAFAKDIMTYWQLKFANIWNNLIVYGMSGQSYQFTGGGGTVSPIKLSQAIFEKEQQLQTQNQESELIKYAPEEIAVFKKELVKAGDVEFMQNEIQSKLTVALQARDQIAYEFFMDPSGQIVFKPPFYNLNVIPNKPVSWINDFEIIDDSITDTEQEVYTHITSSGNAFGGVMDWGLNDEFTTPRTGVYDFHLLRRYGFRRLDYSTEWAGNQKKLFFHLVDYLDRVNAKRQNGTITIPLRPELKLGFPVWIPYYDSFFYVQGLSHQFSVGGQATTTITFMARRQKFVAPNNIGVVKKNSGTKTVTVKNYNTTAGAQKAVTTQIPTYTVSFPDVAGASSGLADTSGNTLSQGQPVTIRDPRTGKLLGYPNVVMVYRSQLNGDNLQKIIQNSGSKVHNINKTNQQPGQTPVTGQAFQYDVTQLNILQQIQAGMQAQLIQRLRAHRYEAGMTNAGAYDYAHDTSGDFKEIGIVPATSITWGTGTQDPNGPTPVQIFGGLSQSDYNQQLAVNAKALANQIAAAKQAVVTAQKAVTTANAKLFSLQKQQAAASSTNSAAKTGNINNIISSPSPSTTANSVSDAIAAAQTDVTNASQQLEVAKVNLAAIKSNTGGSLRILPSLDIIVRPVSDEFGFEVIGHYKYGRGAYIDRGQVQIASGPNATTPGQPINQLNIQFAATAGILSDATQAQPGSGQVINFAAQFEQMQPEDFVTGASFSGTGPGGNIDQLLFTSSSTYTSSMKSNVGKGVWTEADSIRSSKTLSELAPSFDTGISNSTTNCACGLDRAQWLSILPQSVIAQILNPQPATTITGVITNETINSILPGAGDGIATSTTSAILGTATPGDFFNQLGIYLEQQFQGQYDSGNAPRELQDTGQSQGVVTQTFSAPQQNNILGDPSNSPFLGPASLGDPSALKALQGSVNFNFGLTTQEAANAATAFQNGSSQIQQSLRAATPGSKALVSVTTEPPPNTPLTVTQTGPGVTITQPAPQVQPITVQPVPNVLAMILNPSQNTILAAQKNANIPGSFSSGGSPGQIVYPAPTPTGQG